MNRRLFIVEVWVWINGQARKMEDILLDYVCIFGLLLKMCVRR